MLVYNPTLFDLLDLQLFAEGTAGTAGDAAGSDSGDNASAPADGAEAPDTEKETGGRSAKDSKKAAEDLDIRFREARNGEFKALFDAEVASAVQKRLKNVKAKADKFDALGDTLTLLASRYGVDATDTEALSKAIAEDDAYYEKEALDRGMSVENLKALKKVEAENRRLSAEIDTERREKAAQALYNRWLSEGAKVSAIYPSFNLESELQNEQFVSLISNNVGIQQAYEVLHMGELIPAAMQKTEEKTKEAIAAKAATNQRRPSENGSAAQSAAVVKSDPSKLTKAEREELIRRAARGERITFR